MRHSSESWLGRLPQVRPPLYFPICKTIEWRDGFRGSELKVLPIIVFFIVSFAVANAQKKHTVESSDKQNEQARPNGRSTRTGIACPAQSRPIN